MDQALQLLIVEDNLADFALLQRHLLKQGLQANCRRISTLSELLEAIDQGGWDAVFSDYNIPQLDFYEILNVVKTRDLDLPFLLVSGSVGEEQAVELLKLGVWDFVLKENLARLIPALRRSLQDAAERRARHAAESELRDSRLAALNMMEDAVEARKEAESVSLELRQEIVERKRVEAQLSQQAEELRASEQRYRSLFAANPQPMWVYDLETLAFLEVNNAAALHYGYTHDEFLSMTLRDIRPPEELGRLERDGAKLAAVVSDAGQSRHRTKSGEILDVHIYSHALAYNGRAARLVQAHNVTAQRRAEQALRESEERHRLLFETSHDAIMVLAPPDSKLLDANAATARLFGAASEIELCGLKTMDVSPQYQPGGALSAELAASMVQTALTKGSHSFEWTHRRLSGEEFPTLVSLTRMELGGQTLLLATVRDITERKQIEREMQQRLELQSQLAQVAATVPGAIYSFRLRSDGSMSLPYASPALEAVFGVKPEAVREDATPIMATLHPDDIEPLTESIQASARALTPWRSDFRLRDRGHGETWVEAHSVPQLEPDGSVLWRGFMYDITERKRAEGQLRKLSRAVEQSSAAVIITDPSGNIDYINPKFTEFTGYTLEEVLGKNPRLLKSGETSVEVYRELWHTIRAGGEWHGEFHNRRKNGELYWELAAISAIVDETGKITHFLGIKEDITERKHLQSELALRERQLNSFFTDAVAGLALFDNELRYVRINRTLARMNGFSVEAHAGKQLHEMAPEVSRTIETTMRRVLATGEVVADLEVAAASNTEPGTQRHWVESFFPIPGIDGKPEGIGAVVVEITGRKRAEKALSESETRLRLALQAANQGIYDLNVQTGECTVSPEYALMLGHDPETFVETNQAWIERLHPEDRAPAAAVYEAYLKGSIPEYRIEFRQLTKTGDWKWIQSLGRLVARDEAGRPLRLLGTHTDITERKRLESERWILEAQLRQQQKLESIGTLAGGVAHEINNPINGIMNYAQLIQDRLSVGSPLAEYTGEILNETHRVATIVRNLLTFARDEKHSHSPARLTDIVEGTMSLIRTIMRHDQITLTVAVAEDLPCIKCRSQQIQQVLMNLMTNARDALNERYPGHDPDKILDVSARAHEKGGRQWIRVTVEDHGTGITPAVRERMFDPFFTTKPRDKGTGLGMAISHGIVKEHHGELVVESEPGSFTRVHLFLPVDSDWELQTP
jgi:PAS domain S-box-containing protein